MAATPIEAYWVTTADLLIAWAAWVVITMGAVLLAVWVLRRPSGPAPHGTQERLPAELDALLTHDVEPARWAGRHRPRTRLRRLIRHRRPARDTSVTVGGGR